MSWALSPPMGSMIPWSLSACATDTLDGAVSRADDEPTADDADGAGFLQSAGAGRSGSGAHCVQRASLPEGAEEAQVGEGTEKAQRVKGAAARAPIDSSVGNVANSLLSPAP